MIPKTLEPLRVPIEGLLPYKRNPRQGDVGAIVQSLERHGQYRPIVVNARTQEVLAGNHTLAAAKALGWSEIAATFVDVDEDQAARIVLVDNRSNDLAAYDDSALADLLESLPDLDGTGFSDMDLAAFQQLAPGEGGDTLPDVVPEDPRTKRGDLYLLGDRHRLLCGDATVDTDVTLLMGTERADCMWTDPPYGVRYVGKTPDALTIRNDGSEELEALLAESFASASLAIKPGRPVYVAHPAGALSVTFGRCFLGAGWRLHETLVLGQGLHGARTL